MLFAMEYGASQTGEPWNTYEAFLKCPAHAVYTHPLCFILSLGDRRYFQPHCRDEEVEVRGYRSDSRKHIA